METQYHIEKVLKPTETQQAAILHLLELCNTHEGLHMRLDEDMLQERDGELINDYLCYDGGSLVGYLGMHSWGREEKELTGMVHPVYRRRGIFRSLLTTAQEQARSWGGERFALVCERSSVSGLAFVKTTAAQLELSEHEMVLEDFRPRNAFDDRLTFRAATSSDQDAIASLLVNKFHDEEFTKKRVAMLFQKPSQRFYLATLGGEDLGCHEPVGSLRLDEHSDVIGIYGFVIRSDYRGRGYGRQMLEEAIGIIRAEGQKKVMLDVDVDNTNALGLYLSTGFVIKTTYDYYTMDL